MTRDVGRIAVARDGRTHSGPRREQQQGRPADRNAQGVTREQGTSGLGWGTEPVQERKGKEIRPERCVETGYREMGKRLARESGPSDLGSGIWAQPHPSVIITPWDVGCLPPGSASEGQEPSQPRGTVCHGD